MRAEHCILYPTHPVHTSSYKICATGSPVAFRIVSMALLIAVGGVGICPGPRQVRGLICHGGHGGRASPRAMGPGMGRGGWIVSAWRQPSPMTMAPRSVNPCATRRRPTRLVRGSWRGSGCDSPQP